MGFREKHKQIKVIDNKHFGIGSCVVNHDKVAFLLTTDNNLGMLYLTNLKTFVTVHFNMSFEDVYHITSEESYHLSNFINGLVNEANTRSDYGWNSKGLKETEVKFEDN